mmetsp:Transcript_20559/g.44626  ORF Transcript_20559/g.44626 Transcript_20559/m.44626 type:complete len:268 (-) Transcript_20559:204-1007(-)
MIFLEGFFGVALDDCAEVVEDDCCLEVETDAISPNPKSPPSSSSSSSLDSTAGVNLGRLAAGVNLGRNSFFLLLLGASSSFDFTTAVASLFVLGAAPAVVGLAACAYDDCDFSKGGSLSCVAIPSSDAGAPSPTPAGVLLLSPPPTTAFSSCDGGALLSPITFSISNASPAFSFSFNGASSSLSSSGAGVALPTAIFSLFNGASSSPSSCTTAASASLSVIFAMRGVASLSLRPFFIGDDSSSSSPLLFSFVPSPILLLRATMSASS